MGPAVVAVLLHLGAVDKHSDCLTWAQSGECKKNTQFMQDTCPAACENTDKYHAQVIRECEGYARMGECSRNPAFMLSTCRKQCDAWEKEHGLKMDLDSRCVGWSILGKCEQDRANMAHQCNTSCTVHERCSRSNFTGWSIGTRTGSRLAPHRVAAAPARDALARRARMEKRISSESFREWSGPTVRADFSGRLFRLTVQADCSG